jgi:hypothetical protein
MKQRKAFIPLIAIVALCGSAAVLACGKDGPTPPDDENPGTTGSAVLVGAGTIGMCDGHGTGNWDDITASLIDQVVLASPDAKVFAIEPMAEDIANAGATYNDCYGTSWGRHKDRTHPSPGKGDADDPTRWAAYFDYWGDRAGPRDQGYYSFDLGAWHVIVLNSNAGYRADSPQYQWLMADLAGNASKKCTLAIWDRAHFYGTDGSPLAPGSMGAFWSALYGAGADLVINGSHRSWQYYERYAPMNTRGEKDDARGLRQFIVGTGGRWWTDLKDAHPSVEVREQQSRGVLKLTLNADSYDWTFIAAAPSTFTDEGSTACH